MSLELEGAQNLKQSDKFNYRETIIKELLNVINELETDTISIIYDLLIKVEK